MDRAIFPIKNELVFTDKILIEVNGIPLFMVCKGSKGTYYLAISIDYEILAYYVFKTDLNFLYQMLIGKITIMEAITESDELYLVQLKGSSEYKEPIHKISYNELKADLLPEPDKKFKILNRDIAEYTEKLKEKLTKM